MLIAVPKCCREACGGASGSDRPAISEWHGEARATESAAGRGDGRGPLQPPRPPSRAWASAGAAQAPQPEGQSLTAGAAGGKEQQGRGRHERLMRGADMLRCEHHQQLFPSGA